MPFKEILTAIDVGTRLFGGLLDNKASRSQADALSSQAAFSLQFSEQQARYAEEIAELEANLLQKQGLTAQEIALFNAEVARSNAAWEQRAGDIVLDQARRSGQARLSSISAAIASQGRVLDDTTSNGLLAESLAALENDLASIQLTTQSRVARERQQANLIELQGQRAADFAIEQASGRLRAGEIEADGLRQSANLQSANTAIRADNSRLAGRSSLFGAFTDVARIFLNRS